jgi:anthranilate/para-aminobenzoate synthase component I
MRGGRATMQAGAGIVFDSDPTAEFAETSHKADALRRALDLAHARG